MPKAPRQSRNTSSRTSPTKRPSKVKDPKDSHLYTDDNPATTIHGTGFKDRAAAERTLKLIERRSLTYQFQTVNTMWHRANGHPHKNAAIEDAMKLFREWLDVTYPSQKQALRVGGGFKPLLSKDCVKKYLDRIRSAAEGEDQDSWKMAKKFAERYIDLPKGKRLGNTLVDDSKPEEADWERMRYDTLCDLVGEDHEKASSWSDEQLWDRKTQVTRKHLQLIAWAWTPVTEKKLP